MLRKIMALLLMLMLHVSFALAEPATPYPAHTLLRYHAQTEPVRAIIDLLYDGAVHFEAEIALPEGTLYDDVKTAVSVLQEEFPELIHVGNDAVISYYRNDPAYAVSVSLEYVMSIPEHSQLYASLLQAVQRYTAQAMGTAYEKELYLHDTLAEMVVYPEGEAERSNYTAYGALVDGVAACEGYAQALTFLCRMAGVPCSMVTGTVRVDDMSRAHAWNAVFLDGDIVWTDCTFNDQDGFATHWYFNRPAQAMAQTHQTDVLLPWSDSDAWTIERQKGGYIASLDEMQAVFDEQCARYYATYDLMELRAADEELYRILLLAFMEPNELDVSSLHSGTVYAVGELYLLTVR